MGVMRIRKGALNSGWFRSIDLWVMGPAQFLYATLFARVFHGRSRATATPRYSSWPCLSLAYQRLEAHGRSMDVAAEAPPVSHLIPLQWEGPLCDTEGFYQHYGECWNDSLQMIFLFMDGVKEKVQYDLFHTPVTLELVRERLLKVIIPSLVDKIATPFTQYMAGLQKRFLRHYRAEASRRFIWKTHRLTREQNDPMIERLIKGISEDERVRAKGEESVACATSGMFLSPNSLLNPALSKTQTLLTTTLESENYRKSIVPKGRKLESLLPLIKYIVTYFELKPHLKIYFKSINDDLLNTIDIEDFKKYIHIAKGFELSLQTKDGIIGHAISFYTCGNRCIIYDNELGLYEYPWKLLLTSEFEQKDHMRGLAFLQFRVNKTTYSRYPVILSYDILSGIVNSITVLYHITGKLLQFSSLNTIVDTETETTTKTKFTIDGPMYEITSMYAFVPVDKRPFQENTQPFFPVARLSRGGKRKGSTGGRSAKKQKQRKRNNKTKRKLWKSRG